ncbi:MAG: hypothetical protein Q4C95_07270 [Planctomycetia bacterium]|nr:hypothetical protein [Planctomycetia bacterium]
MKFPQKLKQKRKNGDLLYINWKISQGVYQREYFGDWNDPKSHLEYEKRKAVFLLKNETGFNAINDFLTTNELVVQFLDHAKVYYRKTDARPGRRKYLPVI